MIEVQELLGNGDSFAAIEYIQRSGDPLEIAAGYRSLLSELYWKAHDLTAVIHIGRAGILYCLGQSLAPRTSVEEVEKLRSIAKGLAYDIGSFTWPGWEEPGINPTSNELAVGRDCAKLNLRLAIELKKPPDRISMAHWLIGAHALAEGNAVVAEKQFQLAMEILPPEDKRLQNANLSNAGYLAIARLCKNGSDKAAQQQFDAIIGQLKDHDDGDAKTYLTQLASARRLFCH